MTLNERPCKKGKKHIGKSRDNFFAMLLIMLAGLLSWQSIIDGKMGSLVAFIMYTALVACLLHSTRMVR
jgi:hypothetical protein